MIRIGSFAVALCLMGGVALAQPAPGKKNGKNRALSNRVADLIADVREAELKLDVKRRQSKLVRTKRDIVRVAVGDPAVVQFTAFGLREIQFTGTEVGSTTVTMWLKGDKADESDNRTLSMLINVVEDRTAEERRRLSYAELERMVNELFPNSRIQLIPIADKVIVRGQARDEQEANRIMSILRKDDTSGQDTFSGFGTAAGANRGSIVDPVANGAELPDNTLVSMLNVPGVKQVMLKVRIAELSRSAVRRLGVDFNIELEDFLLSSTFGGVGNIVSTATLRENTITSTITALEGNGIAKILAEPNLVVLSGQTANFIAGGQFAVPTVVGVGGAQAATTNFQGFGTQLTFTPTVVDHDRIRLQVAPSFSTLNSANSVQGIFGLDIRSAATVVELREGQTFAIAGLLQEQQSGESNRVPLFGSIPLVRALFESKSYTRDERELLILVTPELVHPLEPEDAPLLLPGMDVTEPDDLEFFVRGHIEGRPCHDHRSTVWWTYRDRLMKAAWDYDVMKRSDDYYLNGDHGFSD